MIFGRLTLGFLLVLGSTLDRIREREGLGYGDDGGTAFTPASPQATSVSNQQKQGSSLMGMAWWALGFWRHRALRKST